MNAPTDAPIMKRLIYCVARELHPRPKSQTWEYNQRPAVRIQYIYVLNLGLYNSAHLMCQIGASDHFSFYVEFPLNP